MVGVPARTLAAALEADPRLGLLVAPAVAGAGVDRPACDVVAASANFGGDFASDFGGTSGGNFGGTFGGEELVVLTLKGRLLANEVACRLEVPDARGAAGRRSSLAGRDGTGGGPEVGAGSAQQAMCTQKA